MKNIKRVNYLLAILITIFCYVTAEAQEGSNRRVEKEETAVIIDSISKLVQANYISEEIGLKVAKYIKTQQASGAYDDLSIKKLGTELTKDLRKVSGDLHMSAYYKVHKETPKDIFLDYKLSSNGETSNYGFVETKLITSNIGYLKIDHFTSPEYFQEAKETIDHSMAILQHTDALIIDLRENPGGFEEIVAYFISYFFDKEPFQLQEYYARYENKTTSISTTNNITSKRLPYIPIYILTSKGTGSAAESFAYLMKHLKRAQIIGETTAGAGNGASNFRVSNEFIVQIATVETINSITKTSWEKVGVIPTIKTSSKMALENALKLAEISALEYREKRIDNYKIILAKTENILEEYQSTSSDELIIKTLKSCHQEGLLNESQINSIGYNFMRRQGKSYVAEAIFKSNTILYPKSPNVFDSYGEALSLNGKKELAVVNYSKAVALAEENRDSNLDLFIKNLEEVKK